MVSGDCVWVPFPRATSSRSPGMTAMGRDFVAFAGDDGYSQ